MQGEEEMRMRMRGKRILGAALLATMLALAAVLGPSRSAGALEVGETAPEFKLASTNGVDISLGDFAGKVGYADLLARPQPRSVALSVAFHRNGEPASLGVSTGRRRWIASTSCSTTSPTRETPPARARSRG